MMKEYTITVTVRARDEFYADQVRDEVVGGIEDGRESGTFEGLTEVSVGDLTEVKTDRHQALIGLAQERHAHGSDDEIEVDDDAILSEGADGIWVQGWLFVPNDVLKPAGIVNPEAKDESETPEPTDTVDSEGGHCD